MLEYNNIDINFDMPALSHELWEAHTPAYVLMYPL